MTPIITIEDELDLSHLEKELVKSLTELNKQQMKMIKTQQRLTENIMDMSFTRDSLSITMRDVFTQMKMLARENNSNVKNEDVKFLDDLIHTNANNIEANKRYLTALKDLIIEKLYLISLRKEFAEALGDVGTNRKIVIKKGLNLDKAKNKMIEQEKIDILSQELNDAKREFDRSRNVQLKKIEQYFEIQSKVSKLWLKLKDATSDQG
ncbi:MAG: hypothetical protein KGD63_15450 [Candidatus Lokiarchaeota archaeon]|nr:hypothetical protein [Candidatus Lokiarchaeota archaeon]